MRAPSVWTILSGVETYRDGKLLIVDADSMDFLGNPEDISTVIDKINAQLHGLF
jgi:deoxyadenosine/deoxycytidine kinase